MPPVYSPPKFYLKHLPFMPETMNKTTHIDAKFIIRIVILNRSSKVTRNALACTIWTPQEIHPIKQRFCIKKNPIFDKQKENCVCNLDLPIKIPGWGKKRNMFADVYIFGIYDHFISYDGHLQQRRWITSIPRWITSFPRSDSRFSRRNTRA